MQPYLHAHIHSFVQTSLGGRDALVHKHDEFVINCNEKKNTWRHFCPQNQVLDPTASHLIPSLMHVSWSAVANLQKYHEKRIVYKMLQEKPKKIFKASKWDLKINYISQSLGSFVKTSLIPKKNTIEPVVTSWTKRTKVDCIWSNKKGNGRG